MEKPLPPKIKKTIEHLLNRFRESDLFQRLSADDRGALVESIEDGDKITIREVARLLKQDEEIKQYFDNAAEEITEEITALVMREHEKHEKLEQIQSKEAKDRAKEQKEIDKLLN